MPTDPCVADILPRRRDRRPRSVRPGVVAVVAVVVTGVVAACTGGGSGGGSAPAIGRPASGPSVPPPALVGGLELEPVDPATALVGDGLAYGSPMPSVLASIEAFRADAEVREVLVREVRDDETAVPLAQVTLLILDGGAFFDEVALDGYLDGLLSVPDPGAAGPRPVRVDVAGTEVRRVTVDGVASAVWLRGDLLALLDGPVAGVELVLERSLAAVAEGRVGSLEPRTPLPPLDDDWPLDDLPSVTFVPFPPAEEEEPPEPPRFGGGLAVEGRIGVVAGERRATVWVVATDAEAIPTVEALELTVAVGLEARTGGVVDGVREVLGRVVLAADGDEGRSARAFRHGRTVLLVEGPDPAQLDAVVSAWIAALPVVP